MKTISLLLVALAYPIAIDARPFGIASSSSSTKKSSFTAKESVLNLRGGDLGPIISGKALAKTFGVLAIGDAITGTVVPISMWKKFGIEV